MKLDVVYEDEYLLVVNKPSGLVVNVSETSPRDTLRDIIISEYSKLFGGEDQSDVYVKRGGIVHRLDKETSGVILIAKNKAVFKELQGQFSNREIEKEYIALVHGLVDEERIEVDAPLGRNPKKRVKMAIVEGGRDSLTIVEKIKEVEIPDWKFTLIRAYPKTGRTHQIRVHLSALNHPVVGDRLYSGRRQQLSREVFNRLMLHSHKISFTHPQTSQKVTFEAILPSEFNLS